jgi:hypothetical protein
MIASLTQSPTPTPAPQDAELRRRQDSPITTAYFSPNSNCGYLGGNKDNQISCPDGQSCAIFAIGPEALNLRCCDDFTNACANKPPPRRVARSEAVSSGWCNTTTIAQPSSSLPTLVSTNCPAQFSGTTVCGATDLETLVATVRLEVGNREGGFLACGHSFKSQEFLWTQYIGQSDFTAWTTSLFGRQRSQVAGGVASSGPAVETAPASTSGASQARQSEAKQAAPAAVIVGGVIGGLGLLAVSVVAGLWVVMRQRRMKAEAEAAAAIAAAGGLCGMHGRDPVQSQHYRQHPTAAPLMAHSRNASINQEPVEVDGSPAPVRIATVEAVDAGALRPSWRPTSHVPVEDSAAERPGHVSVMRESWAQGVEVGEMQEADTGSPVKIRIWPKPGTE